MVSKDNSQSDDFSLITLCALNHRQQHACRSSKGTGLPAPMNFPALPVGVWFRCQLLATSVE